MSFGADLNQFAEKVQRNARAVHLGSFDEVVKSITEGSEIAGAAGVPVDQSILKNSYLAGVEHVGPWEAQCSSGERHARPIELGVGPHGPMTLRSEVGQFGNLEATRQGWDNIVDHVRREVTGG